MILEIDNMKIFVRDINRGARETVVFLHGWPLSNEMFEYQFNALAASGIRCVGIDLPGFGSSEKPWDGYGYDNLSDIVHKVINTLALNNVTLLGFSMGGGIAAKYAAKFGNGRVKRLILLGAACPSFVRRPDYPFGQTVEYLNGLINDVQNDKPKAFSEFSKLVFDGDISPEFMNWFGNMANQTAVWSAVRGLESLRDEDLRDDLEKINIPTAIFHGVKDRVCPFELAEQTHMRIKDSFVVPFEKSGHGIFYEEKEKLSLAILDFIKSQPRVTAAAEVTRHYKFTNMPLPYDYAALEPYIDERTMRIHHDKHLQGYVDNLNAALKDYPAYHGFTLERLLLNLQQLPEEIRIPVGRNAGGVYNHFFYFDGMTDKRQDLQDGDILSMINEHFGSFDAFKAKFKEAALSVFGSGYAWLVLDSNYTMTIITTANQDTPLAKRLYPLLNIDVWEHAYYLKHYNMRADYIDNWWNVVNWNKLSERLAKVK